MVTKDGFSIAYEVFSGSTFEGHTFIPSIQKFVTKNKVKDFTIVADDAMISDDNIKDLIANNAFIIERYHELYKIEQNFRIAKSDLQTRPIFHFKEEPIKLHLLICFMALVVSRNIELSTGASIRSFIQECKKITDARLTNLITKEEIKMRTPLTPKIIEFLTKLKLLI